MGSIPLVALSVKGPEVPDAMDQYAKLLQLKAMKEQAAQNSQLAPLQLQAAQNQAQSSGIDLQNRQRAQQQQAAAEQAIKESNGDISAALPKIMSIAPEYGAKLQTQIMQSDEAGYKAKKAVLDYHEAQMGRFAQIAGTATDPQSYAAAIQQAANEQLIDPQTAQQYLQRGFDPNTVKGIQTQALTALQQIQQKNQELKQAEDERHNKATEANTAATNANTQAYRQAQLAQENKKIGIEQAKLAFQQKQSGAGAEGEGLVDAVGTGKISIDRLGYIVARNPQLLEAVSAKYPDFDSTKAGAYVAAYKDFTSSKNNTAGGALNAGATALAHLKELKDMNTKASHIPGTPDYNAYMNKADTVSMELARFYGDSTIPAIATIKKTLTATLPGNRDAAIATQAQSMGDKFDSYQQTWENAAPSAAYQAPMPGISEKAKAARAALDPRYRAAQQQSAQPKVGDKKTFPNGNVGEWDGQGYVLVTQ